MIGQIHSFYWIKQIKRYKKQPYQPTCFIIFPELFHMFPMFHHETLPCLARRGPLRGWAKAWWIASTTRGWNSLSRLLASPFSAQWWDAPAKKDLYGYLYIYDHLWPFVWINIHRWYRCIFFYFNIFLWTYGYLSIQMHVISCNHVIIYVYMCVYVSMCSIQAILNLCVELFMCFDNIIKHWLVDAGSGGPSCSMLRWRGS